jgi:hypothetical protein
MSTKLTIVVAATMLIIGGSSYALAEDTSPADLSMTVPTGPSAQTFSNRPSKYHAPIQNSDVYHRLPGSN